MKSGTYFHFHATAGQFLAAHEAHGNEDTGNEGKYYPEHSVHHNHQKVKE
jgi:hypothetical protein